MYVCMYVCTKNGLYVCFLYIKIFTNDFEAQNKFVNVVWYKEGVSSHIGK